MPRRTPEDGLSWADMPLELQLHIMGLAPLADLARAATLCKGMQAAYRERLQEREACIQANLAEGWPPEVTDGLSEAHMALPRDLIVTPPVCHIGIGIWLPCKFMSL
jgi:hypothetical protein